VKCTLENRNEWDYHENVENASALKVVLEERRRLNAEHPHEFVAWPSIAWRRSGSVSLCMSWQIGLPFDGISDDVKEKVGTRDLLCLDHQEVSFANEAVANAFAHAMNAGLHRFRCIGRPSFQRSLEEEMKKTNDLVLGDRKGSRK
jgi:hypothetical protein